MSRLGKTEQLIFSVALLVLLAFSYFLYDDSLLFPHAHNDKLELIGDVALSQNDVRRKNLDTFSWLPASRTDAIYQNDSVFTGDRSEAVIRLQDGSQIHVEPNSLITLNLKNGQMNLDLRYGNLVGELAKGSALVIKSGSEEFKLEGSGTSPSGEKSKVRFNKAHSGTVDLKLISGQVRFSDKKKSTQKELSKESVVAVSPKGEIKQVDPAKVQLSPAGAEITRVRTTPDEPLPFEWQGQGDISSYEFEISPNADFTTLSVNKTTPSSKVAVTEPLEPGEYYWRVKALDHNGQIAATSPSQKMNLQHLSPPTILTPQKASEISLELQAKPNEELTTKTEIKWQGPAQFKTYTYQIAQDPSFSQPLKEEQTSSFSALSPNLPNGSYWVRVAGQIAQNAPLLWSEAIPFKVNLFAKKDFKPERPVLIAKKIAFKAPSLKDRNPAAVPAPTMEWKPVAESQKYLVQVSKDIDFKKAEIYEVTNTKTQWAQFKGGHSYYRVFAVGKNGKRSDPSLVGTIQVELSSPILEPIKPIKGLGEVPTPQEASVSWSEIPDASGYLVQLDRGDKFTEPQAYEFKTNSGRLTLPTPGDYKVRVQALDESNKPLTDFSNIEDLKFTFQIPLKTPTLLEPYDNVSIFLQKATEPAIWVEWKKVKGADSYKIEISDREDFSHVVISSAVTGNRFLIKNKIPLGKLYWRVRAESKNEGGQLSEWTEKRGFTVYHQKSETF